MNPHRLALFVILITVPALANALEMPVITSIPTLGEWGLIGLAACIGSLGAWLISRNK